MNEKKSLNFDFLDDSPKKTATTLINDQSNPSTSGISLKSDDDESSSFFQYFKQCFTDFVRFSEKYLTTKSPKYLFVAILFLGMGITADRLSGSIKDYSTWGEVWAITAIGGLITGYIGFYIAGTIYHWRVKWSKGRDDVDTSKNIWLFSGLPIAATSLLSLIFNQMAYGSSYFDGEYTTVDLIAVFLYLAALIYSIRISYKAVRHIQKVEKRRAVLWFIVAPTLYYIIIFGIGLF